MDTTQPLEKEIAVLRAELAFCDLKTTTIEHQERMSWALDLIRSNFAEHSDFIPSVSQITRTRALITLANVSTGDVTTFVLFHALPDRMMTILDFVWAVFMERATSSVLERLNTTELPAFCAQLVRFTEGADYDRECEIQ